MKPFPHATAAPDTRFDASDLVTEGLPLGDPNEPLAYYGDAGTTVWLLNALGRPAGRSRGWGKINFGELTGDWLTTAKDLAVVLLNPSHPKIVGRSPTTDIRRCSSPVSVNRYVRALRDYHSIARWRGMPADLSSWTVSEYVEALAHLQAASDIDETTLRYLERVPRMLYSLRDLIRSAPGASPWRSVRTSPVAKEFARSWDLKTQPVDPDVYFALLTAALAYVQAFATDILRGLEGRRPVPFESERFADYGQTIRNYLERDDTVVPLHDHPGPAASQQEWESSVNWSRLGYLIVGKEGGQVFGAGTRHGQSRREWVVAKARVGAVELGVVTPEARLHNRERAWSDPLSASELNYEARMLRAACYIVIASLTMMRDSEIQEIQRGSLTTYYGTPAIRSRLVKGEPERPTAHWWITQPVQDAVEVMERLSIHPTQLFASLRVAPAVGSGVAIGPELADFRTHINNTAARTGLAPVKDGEVTPHMFRRTMALITEYERGGQIAALHQLKHAYLVSRGNSMTGAYTAPTERWAAELHERQAHHQAQRAMDDLALAERATPAGPGAKRFAASVSAPAAVLDPRAKSRLLAQTFPDLQMGTANLCLGDRSVAACLPDAERNGSKPVQPAICEPSKCPNAVVLPMQEPLWNAEERTLLSLRATPRLSAHSKVLISTRLTEVQRVTRSFP